MWENATIYYKIAGIIIAGLLMIILGKVNEKKKLNAGSKLIFQILISLIIIYSGIRIEFLRNPATPGSYIYFSFLSIPLTLIWVIGITNSIGQTGELGDITPYIVFIASLTFFTVTLLQRQGLILAEILSLSLAVVSFIVIKYFPRGKFSSFYMLFGFILAVIAIVGVSKSTAALTLFIPLLILGVPLVDSSYSVVSSYVVQQRKVGDFSTTESRLRQKLQSYGFSAHGANYTIIATSLYLSLSALIISIYQSLYLLAIMSVFGWVIFEMLKKKVSSEELIIEKDLANNRIKLFQVGIDRVDVKSVISRIEEFILTKKSHLVVTPDTLAILRTQKDADYFNIIQSANLVTPDGAGILWATTILNHPLSERVTGIDIIQGICKLAAKKAYSIYLLGASPGIAKEASLKLTQKYPGLKIVGNHHGYFHAASLSDETVIPPMYKTKMNSGTEDITKKGMDAEYNERNEEAKIIQEINNKKPDILLVGMGVPRQEKWIAANLKSKRLNVPVCMGVGGSFDVLSGKIPRAPLWMQRHGMEWVYRFIKQPKRAFHTLALFYFMGLVIMGKIILTLKNTD
ncbi:MAG: WecB/TagA/CpsF family glycosyltransferase [Candidatus Caldatribacteriota bacterium]|nr:WecB/TagA/CpsF family glycosyltransferase [Candidatus Caldatribacteriota bacterium]